MAESALNLTYANLKTQVAFLIGDNPSSPNYATRIDEVIQAGYRKFLDARIPNRPAHRWSFLRPRYQLTLSAPYSTGTVAIAAGVVTLTGGTFPAWAASGELILLGEHYAVSTRDSGTQLTLEDTSVTAASGSGYSLVQTEYDLPDNFGWLEGDRITFEPSGNSLYIWSAYRVADEVLRERRSRYSERITQPECFAIFPDAHVYDGTESVRWKMQFWPAPDAAYKVTFRYVVLPPPISDSNDYFLGGAQYAETIREAVLSEAEVVFLDQPGDHTRRFYELLPGAIQADQQAQAPATLGYNGDCSDEYYDSYDHDLRTPLFGRVTSFRTLSAP